MDGATRSGYVSPRWSAEFVDCALPMTFDQYSTCGFNCIYCFSQYRKAVGKGKAAYRTGKVHSVNPATVKRLFTGGFQDPTPHQVAHSAGWWQFNRFIRDRRVLQWGGLADPFCPHERRLGVGLELLRFFRSIHYPISFSTKATWFTDDVRYMDLLRGVDHYHFKVSMTTGDAAKAAAIERNVSPPKERLAAIGRLAKVLGGDAGVTLRLRPFIIGVSNPGHVQLVRDAANAGVTGVSVEFFCLETRSTYARSAYRAMSVQAGYDVVRFYKRYSAGSGYLRLSREVKRPYVEELLAVCRELGLRFYISDAHFKELSDGGCCCGLPDSWNYCRGQLCEALQIAKRAGEVRWSDLQPHLAFAETFSYGRAVGFNSWGEGRRAMFVGRTMLDYLRWNWNSPETLQSPYQFFGGVLTPSSKDEHGNIVYRWSG